MDKPERKINRATSEAERRAAQQRQRREVTKAAEVRRQRAPETEKKALIDPARQKALDKILLKLSPDAEKRRRELSNRPLSQSEERLARQARAAWTARTDVRPRRGDEKGG